MRPKPFSLETTDEGEAIRQILDYRANPALHSAGQWEMELDNYIAEKRAAKRLSRFYASSRRAVLMAFAVEYGISSPTEVSPELAQRWYDKLKLKNANTAKHYIVHLRVFLEFLVERRKILRVNAARDVRMVRVKQKAKTDFVASRGVTRILAFARLQTRKAKEKGGVDRLERAREMELMVHLGFDAACRKNEIIEARPGWFSSLGRGSIHICDTVTFTPKDSENRTIPLTSRFKRFLKREFPRGLPSPFVVQPENTHGKSLYRYEPKKAFAGFFTAANIRSVKGRLPNIHMMRHSFASNRLIAGVSLYRVAKWLGDDQDTVQRHYGHLLPHDAEIDKGV